MEPIPAFEKKEANTAFRVGKDYPQYVALIDSPQETTTLR